MFYRLKKFLNLILLDYYSIAKTEECDQSAWRESDQFEFITTYSTSCNLEVNATVSGKAVTSDSLRVKNYEGFELFF